MLYAMAGKNKYKGPPKPKILFGKNHWEWLH